MIQVQEIPNKGRGIVATRYIPQASTIETAPAIAFPGKERKLIDQTKVFEYYFVNPSDARSRRDKENLTGYLVFGNFSLCNHSFTPNAKVEWRTDAIGTWVRLIALQDIHPGQEITMYYANIDEYSGYFSEATEKCHDLHHETEQ